MPSEFPLFKTVQTVLITELPVLKKPGSFLTSHCCIFSHVHRFGRCIFNPNIMFSALFLPFFLSYLRAPPLYNPPSTPSSHTELMLACQHCSHFSGASCCPRRNFSVRVVCRLTRLRACQVACTRCVYASLCLSVKERQNRCRCTLAYSTLSSMPECFNVTVSATSLLGNIPVTDHSAQHTRAYVF